jgi:proteasome accessory factor A
MINPKWETFYANEGRHRLHVLFGEANQSRYAYALKVGTTHLVLRLLEEGVLKGRPRLLHPIHALQDISRDPTYKWMVDCEHGSMSAVEIQREHLEWAQRYQGESEETDWVLREWERTLDDLSLDPMRTADRLDWTAKKMMLARYLEDSGGEWSDDALHSIDLEYHNIDPEKSLFHALGLQGFGDDLDDLDAMTIPPTNTRAHGRGKLVKHLLDGPRRRAAIIDWSGAAVGRDTYLDFSDPFEPGDDVLSQLEPSAPAE